MPYSAYASWFSGSSSLNLVLLRFLDVPKLLYENLSTVLQGGLCSGLDAIELIWIGLTYENTGHMALTYRQIKQYPDPKSRGPIVP
jgi:hypothetical protein